MIRGLKIRNFRGIKEGELEFSPITILLGPNNSGKSTVLEALFLAPNPGRGVPYFLPDGRNSALDVVRFLHRTLDYVGYAFLLHNYTSERSEIECDTGGDKYLLELAREGSQIFLTTNKELKNLPVTQIRGVETGFFGRISLINTDMDIYSNAKLMEDTLLVSPNLIKLGYQYLWRNWAPIINSGICRKVAEDASGLSPESYRDVTMEPFIGGQLEIYAYLEDGRRIRLGDLGEGIQNYAISRILYGIADPEILLWDDIESHLNPRILLHIADWFSDLLKNERQVILSTHSLEASKIIAGVNEDETAISLTSLDDSILKTKKLTLTEVEELQEAGIDARTAEAILL